MGQSNQQCLLEEVEHACVAQGEDSMIQQSTYFGPNFRKWSEFGLFPENQSEFGLNLLRKSDFSILDGRQGLGRGLLMGFWALPLIFFFI